MWWAGLPGRPAGPRPTGTTQRSGTQRPCTGYDHPSIPYKEMWPLLTLLAWAMAKAPPIMKKAVHGSLLMVCFHSRRPHTLSIGSAKQIRQNQWLLSMRNWGQTKLNHRAYLPLSLRKEVLASPKGKQTVGSWWGWREWSLWYIWNQWELIGNRHLNTLEFRRGIRMDSPIFEKWVVAFNEAWITEEPQ